MLLHGRRSDLLPLGVPRVSDGRNARRYRVFGARVRRDNGSLLCRGVEGRVEHYAELRQVRGRWNESRRIDGDLGLRVQQCWILRQRGRVHRVQH